MEFQRYQFCRSRDDIMHILSRASEAYVERCNESDKNWYYRVSNVITYLSHLVPLLGAKIRLFMIRSFLYKLTSPLKYCLYLLVPWINRARWHNIRKLLVIFHLIYPTCNNWYNSKNLLFFLQHVFRDVYKSYRCLIEIHKIVHKVFEIYEQQCS